MSTTQISPETDTAAHTLDGHNIQSGEFTPHQLTVDMQSPELGAIPDRKKPWLDLPGFILHMKETGHRIHLLFIHKRHAQHSQSIHATPAGPDTTRSSNIQTKPTIHSPVYSSSRPRMAFMAETKEQENPNRERSDLNLSQHCQTTPSTTRVEGPGSQLNVETHVEPDNNYASTSAARPYLYPDISNDHPCYIPPPIRSDDDEWKSSAIVFKDGAGEVRGHKMFYDTASSDNWASEKLVKVYDLKPRLILPQDLHIYNTVNGNYTPTKYVEIWLKDDSRNIKEFTKVVFNITPSMEGLGLVGGTTFIQEHGIVIDPKRPRDAFVTVGRKADAGKKRNGWLKSSINANHQATAAQEAQNRLLEQARAERKLAQELASTSTARSTTTKSGTSQEQPAPFSQTSVSSSAKTNAAKI